MLGQHSSYSYLYRYRLIFHFSRALRRAAGLRGEVESLSRHANPSSAVPLRVASLHPRRRTSVQPGKRPGSAQRMRFLRQRFRQRLKTIVERAAGRGRAGEALPVGRLAMEPGIARDRQQSIAHRSIVLLDLQNPSLGAATTKRTLLSLSTPSQSQPRSAAVPIAFSMRPVRSRSHPPGIAQP
ncbi:hypothetical protein VTN96DRAFT_7355 [Rasamsonia emersonii]